MRRHASRGATNKIAWLMFSNDGEYVSREHIARTVWADSDKRVDGALDAPRRHAA